jgi:nucleoside-diphosphate-sugar epimerase
LTDPAEVDQLVAAVAPTVIIHLAAVIPPQIYRHPKPARRVNVDATAALLGAATASSRPIRFVQASSNAVHGSRNPRRNRQWLRAATPVRPSDLYGAHKVEAEELVRASGLAWVILRLAGVISVDLRAMPLSMDAPFWKARCRPTDASTPSMSATSPLRSPSRRPHQWSARFC